MADLDAELLALAGGDDSSDEESPAISQQKDKDKERQASPGSSSSNDQDDDADTMGRKGVARPVKRQCKRARAYDDDEEEGELSSSSVHSRRSLRSASMSESESDTSPPPEENQGPIFPYEKLFYSAKDKSEIMALPEIQREELLSERAQQVDRHNQDIALRRLLANREREEARAAAKKKRKAGSADLEDSQRKSSRKKTVLGGRKVGEPSDAIEAYKRQREQKGKRDEQRRRDASSRKNNNAGSSPAREADDRDASGESEVEWDDKPQRRSVSPPRYDPPAELRELQRARIARSNFAQVCFYPGFDQAISNCYTRKLNTENVRKAQLAERKAAKLAAAAVARGEAVADRFARVKTRARTYYESTDGHLVPVKPDAVIADRSRAITPTGATSNNTDASNTPANGTTPRSVTPSKPATPKVYKGVPVIRHRPTDEDNIAALDLDIDIEI
ncbi:hypothetical protein TEQG_01628 [Trichophyton equinum CBS 127.97]|uniref:Plus3 domain-containing protein n=1 Tax=Trichophyton equinum (strain ATCC MYA-4606 / CBS 127.97) TaxID=559882 RepID=F2PKZ5_TRIEC|nr:hypothetical protein TEQG_01628 [Trichophyton equinum CBS 127.97]